MALLIAGERSGVGKTTFTWSLLSFLARGRHSVQSFKVGPDYIDPRFHQRVTGRPCLNLDPVLTSPEWVKDSWRRGCQSAEFALVEGAMGLFDGVSYQGIRDFASSAHIARLLGIPAALVVDCSRLSGSVAAIVQGYGNFDPEVKLAGVFLNRVASRRHFQLLEQALELLHLPILGTLYRGDLEPLQSRHLGLVPAPELANFTEYQDQLAHLAQAFNWRQLWPLLSAPTFQESWENPQIALDPPQSPFPRETLTPLLPFPERSRRREKGLGDEGQQSTNKPKTRPTKIPIAIAQDLAFNFYYAENLALLEANGAELMPFSPLQDQALPQGAQGLILGGGFPEVFAEELSQNRRLIEDLQTKIRQGLPVYAECGGLMYLCGAYLNAENKSYPWLGILPADCRWSDRLTLGYRQAKTIAKTGFAPQGTQIRAHEFHRTQLTVSSEQLAVNSESQLARSSLITDDCYRISDLCHLSSDLEGWSGPTLHASYLHVHFGGALPLMAGFLGACRRYS
ncbi:MAG: cobyrinate a,c-diamide synthase [Cyanobacteriota bacterium]|nr:cobyrinate a,c-diamide synthase [Cyanobacteriota bacterium]